MAETVKEGVRLVEQGHVRVGPQVVTDPAFLVTRYVRGCVLGRVCVCWGVGYVWYLFTALLVVSFLYPPPPLFSFLFPSLLHCYAFTERVFFPLLRNMEDFVTWVDTSKIRRHVEKYNDRLDDFDLL